jgi:Uma2 family endonuclease
MSTLPKNFVTPEEYLELERKAERKSEYYNGEVFAMAGVSTRHDDIVAHLHFLIAQQLRGKDCRRHTSDMRVLAIPGRLYTYPDLTVVCGKRQFEDKHVDTLTNPTLLVEVLSPTTERYDRGLKAKLYRDIPSLQELLLVSQESYEVELYRRQANGTWSILPAGGLDASVELASIGCTLRMRDLYATVLTEDEGATS